MYATSTTLAHGNVEKFARSGKNDHYCWFVHVYSSMNIWKCFSFHDILCWQSRQSLTILSMTTLLHYLARRRITLRQISMFLYSVHAQTKTAHFYSCAQYVSELSWINFESVMSYSLQKKLVGPEGFQRNWQRLHLLMLFQYLLISFMLRGYDNNISAEVESKIKGACLLRFNYFSLEAERRRRRRIEFFILCTSPYNMMRRTNMIPPGKTPVNPCRIEI